MNRKIDGLDEKIDKLTEKITKIEIGQAALTEKVEAEQTRLVKDISDLKGTKSLTVPIVVAVLTAFLTVFGRSLPGLNP
jgi:hypothetical protein